MSDPNDVPLDRNPVVITGAGIVCSLGHEVKEIWGALLSAKSGIGPIEGCEAEGLASALAAKARGLDCKELETYFKWARIMDVHSVMLMQCARDAFRQAKLEKATLSADDIGLFVGMGMVDYKIEDLGPAVLGSLDPQGGLSMDAFYSGGYRAIYPLWPLSMLNNISACLVAIELNIRGENSVFSPDADAGAQAVAEGVKVLLDQRARALLAGGVSEKLSPASLARAHLNGCLTGRNGTILGEGCGVLALELKNSADERGIPYTTAITGHGAAFGSDRDCLGPTPDAMGRAMKTALKEAGLAPDAIDVVVVQGQQNELDAIGEIFSCTLNRIRGYCSRGALGHMLAASPSIDIIIGTEILNHGMIPPTLPLGPADPTNSLDLFARRPQEVPVRRLLVNGYGPAGQCATAILEKVR